MPHDILEDLLEKARAFGASAADALLSDSSSLSVSYRMGKKESVSRSEEAEIGLRVFVGKKQAIVSSSDRHPETLTALAERAVAMAKSVPDDPYAGLADAADITRQIKPLESFDATVLTPEQLGLLAARAEEKALAEKGITNSDGAEAAFGVDHVHIVASNGFSGSYSSSGFSLSVSVIAGSGTAMETDYAHDSATFFSDLHAPEKIGAEAARRTLRALHPRKGRTKKIPVVFDRRIAGSIPGAFANAISGSAIAKGTSFLKDKMNGQVFARGITITDDPFLARGARSRPFDAEGLSPKKRNLIDDGVLTGWLLDLASARQLGLSSTGNAARGTSSPPSPRPSNLYLAAGALSPDEMIRDIKEGFYVTEFLGSGGSILTGDYSRGAKGFWIENGEIAFPVSEMTIAGNLRDMWLNLLPANDLDIRYGTDAPTLRIDSMTVAGE